MKSFPHQVSKIVRFAAGLAVFGDLDASEADLADDGVVGDALARAGAYKFRGSSASDHVEDLLATEHLKSSSDQGTRTMARELRRTFEGLGLIIAEAGKLRLSRAATELLSLGSDVRSQEADALWRRAFHDLVLADHEGTSHPYEIMLRLVSERPGIPKPLLGLALEARNDSDAEFDRLLQLADGDPTTPAWDLLGVSLAQQRNAIKILPAVAEQLGEMVIAGGQAYIALPDPLRFRAESRRRSAGARRSRRRRYDRDRNRGQRPAATKAILRSYDPDLVAARYRAHENCLAAFDALFAGSLPRWEGDFDLVAVVLTELLLVEVKTIRADADNQVRLGLGQLLYYEHFDVRPEWPGASIHRMLVADGPIDQELTDFLDTQQVGLVTQSHGATWIASPRANEQLAHFGVRP